MMSQTDHPEDAQPSVPDDPALTDTGLWPSPILDEPGQNEEPEASAVVADIGNESQTRPLGAEPSVAGERPPAAGSSREILETLRLVGEQLDQRLVSLQTLFEREIRAEATRERIVDRLHAELQEYKHDLLLKVQRPIFVDLIQLHDDLGKMIEAQPPDAADREALRGTLESIRTAIEDILYRQGVEPFRLESDEFDPRRQRAVSTVPTEEQELNKCIAGRLRPGFQSGDKIIRPELVSVYTQKQ
jgi:molecular chaperone GrpE